MTVTPADRHRRWTSPEVVGCQLARAGYLCDDRTAQVLFVARALAKPVLVEGPAGVGKTSLATAVADAIGARLVRLQCHEALDESKALYDWNYRKQLLAISDATPHRHVFAEEFLVARPVLDVLTAERQTVLLIDEIDRADMRAEALLLEVLAEHQMTIPELGTIRARHPPIVVLTASGRRELSEALRRRCLPLALAHPDDDRERAIVARRLPGIGAELAADLLAFAGRVRADAENGAPVDDAVTWATTLVRMGVDVLDDDVLAATLDALAACAR